MRTSKTIDNVKTEYVWLGDMLIREQTGTNVTYYLYDENGSAIGFEYNGTPYYYLKNIQGDVVSIVDNSGVVVVNYTYNAWGEIISITGTMADTIGQVNKLRYRSYYYDSETGFYYLQSRYYDPIVKRFISPDSTDYLTANGDFDGYNLYAYCLNNPVMYSDPSGYRSGGGRGRVCYSFIVSQTRDTRVPGFISKMGSIPLGSKGNIAQNGCGVIACYNVMCALYNTTSFSSVYSYFNKNIRLIDGGKYGVNPASISSYLFTKFPFICEWNIATSGILTNLFMLNVGFDAVIILYGNTQSSWHYVAGINNGRNKYNFYNCSYVSNSRAYKIGDFLSVIKNKGKALIWMIGVS